MTDDVLDLEYGRNSYAVLAIHRSINSSGFGFGLPVITGHVACHAHGRVGVQLQLQLRLQFITSTYYRLSSMY